MNRLTDRMAGGYGARVWATALAALLLGCQTDSTDVDSSIATYRDRMLAQHQEDNRTSGDRATPDGQSAVRRPPVARPVEAQASLPERAALMTQPATTTQPTPAEILAEIPDPTEAPQVYAERLERLRAEVGTGQDQRVLRNYEQVVKQANEYLRLEFRPQQMRLGLATCIQHALERNYTIRYEAYNPAISQTQLVEAEAAFDVEFFLDTNWADKDSPVLPGTPPSTGESDTRSISGGFRQLLPTGMQATVGMATQRNWSGAPQGQIKTWNPTWPSNFVATLQQPLLRGFGLDVNRAQINISRQQYDISREQFLQKVRDTLLDVENAYWNLVLTRRQAAVLAESVAQNYVTYKNMVERLNHDATQVEVANSESRWRTSYVNYLEAVKLVRDAEDRLKNLLNHPGLKLSDEVELVPTETPFAAPVVIDHFAEVRTALDQRSEIRQVRRQIEVARVSTLVAKNGTLPRLDLSFQYEVQGLGNTADNSFDNLTTNRFNSYTVGASFSYSLGERASRAALRRARLQEAQAVVLLNQVTDGIVEEVNRTIRLLMVRYTQIPPQLDAVNAAVRNLRALQARTQRIDPNYLQTELGAVEQLASTRTTLARVLTDYNSAIVQLEKAKGTLLDYNNVIVADAQAAK